MFIIIFVLIIFLMHYVCIAWLFTNTPLLTFGKRVKVLPFLLSFFFILAMLLSRRIHNSAVLELVREAGHLWLGILFICFTLILFVLAIQLLFKLIKHPITLRLGFVVIVTTIVISTASIIEAFQTPELVGITLESKIEGTDGIKIVQISDTHFGGTITPARAKKLTEQVNALEPDFIFFTGDIFEDLGEYSQLYMQALKDMHAKIGKFGVPGNHEYYRGVNISMDLFRQANITPLQNQFDTEGMINIIGINDITASNLEEQSLIKILDIDTKVHKFNILLSHTPLYFETAVDHGVNLMLSGHTHNGQIWPFNYLVRLRFKHINGLHRYKDGTLYISSGTFYWGPAFRFKTSNELTLITLKEVK